MQKQGKSCTNIVDIITLVLLSPRTSDVATADAMTLVKVFHQLLTFADAMSPMKGLHKLVTFEDTMSLVKGFVTGPPGALSFDVKPEIMQEKSLELKFQMNCRLGIYCIVFPVVSG